MTFLVGVAFVAVGSLAMGGDLGSGEPTDLYDAAVSGDLAAVKRIVNAHPEAVNVTDEHGFTALHGLAEEEHPEIALYLLDHGANVNASNDDGVTPLHLAGWPEMARLFLRRGARLEATTRTGETPLLMLAAEPEREDVLGVLLEAGARVNARGADGRTALDIAIARKEPGKVALLRRHGGKTARELDR